MNVFSYRVDIASLSYVQIYIKVTQNNVTMYIAQFLWITPYSLVTNFGETWQPL